MKPPGVTLTSLTSKASLAGNESSLANGPKGAPSGALVAPLVGAGVVASVGWGVSRPIGVGVDSGIGVREPTGVGAALGGYGNTSEGKMIAASLADNYNGIVRAVRANPSLQRDVGSLSEEAGTRVKGSYGQGIGEELVVWVSGGGGGGACNRPVVGLQCWGCSSMR